MQPFSIVAIYLLFWVFCAFLMLPFGIRTQNQADSGAVRGQADSAPINFRPLRLIGRTTLLATLLFGAFYANYEAGWITIDDIDLVKVPPEIANRQYGD